MMTDLGYTITMSTGFGLYGGSFNPIHRGHTAIARAIADHLRLERVIFLPSANPPHKHSHQLADSSHRAQMVKLAIAEESFFEFSDYDLLRDGPSYTIDTVTHFQQMLGENISWYWIIGADSLADLPTWHRVCDLIDACQIVTAARPGWETIDWARLEKVVGPQRVLKLQRGIIETPLVDVSSSEIRAQIAQGQNNHDFVHDLVADYIEKNALYR